MPEEPKSCPYCGAEPQTFQTALSRCFRIACMNVDCYVRPDTTYRKVSEEFLVNAWNTRVGAA